MNRFRTKKKAKEPAEGSVRASTDSDGPEVPAIKTSKTFRRGKKNQEPEPKLELDLANALPPSDDFRTSLLMSGLSARFSMLREQDDPISKIGKASDDSVLFPSMKRQSRLNNFGFQSYGLSDIAEVSSINGSIRPPFAFGRTDSDGYGTDDDSTNGGSIMNRAKPGEGNNLFGGRQKIYKIPASRKSLTDGGGGGMGGRALYENDVSQSAFQKLRQREKEQQQQEHEEAEGNAQSSRPESPQPSGYNRNRETSSTTSSGGPSITRSSTAGTSFTSQRTPSLSGSHTSVSPVAQGLDRNMSKGRRLYETGLDQHLHEQQYSAMNRIDTLTRQRALGAQTPPPGLSSPTGLHSSDRWDRQQITGKSSMPNMRATSPPPNVSGMGTFDFGVRPDGVADTKPSFGMASPPLSPPMSETEDHTILVVQPNDRGKATALGAFAKPAQPYDENKYSQRQLQMQQGRETPPLGKQSPPHPFAPRQQQTGRTRAHSNANFSSARSRSRSNSSAQRHLLPEVTSSQPQITVPEDEAMGSGTFLTSSNSSFQDPPDDVDQVTKPKLFIRPVDLYRQNQHPILERPPESQHPANRQQPLQQQKFSVMVNSEQSPSVPVSNSHLATDAPSTLPTHPVASADSPTLGPTTGLSGMVRQHLRSDSNTSSLYGGVPSPRLVSRFHDDSTEPLPQNQYTTKNNPWNEDDWAQTSYEEDKFKLDNAVNDTKGGDAMPTPFPIRSPHIDEAVQETHRPSWEKEMETHHTRDGSSETQKERQDFKNELAARRRRVQENLKSFAEIESRSTSPLPASDWSRDGPAKNNALGLLKNKSTRGSLVVKPKETKEAGQPKAIKMLGFPNTTRSGSPSPGKSDFEENMLKKEEEEMLRGAPRGSTIPPQINAFRQARRDAQGDREQQLAKRHQNRMAADAQGGDGEWSNGPIENQPRPYEPLRERVLPNIRSGHRTPSRERGPPPVTQNYRNGTSRERKGSIGTNRSGSIPPSRTSRDRSSSDASGRSKSHNGRYRDDLASAVPEVTASSSQGAFEDFESPSSRLIPKSSIPSMAVQPSTIPSPMVVTNTASRTRSNSKSPPAGYFDTQKLQTLQNGEGMDIGLLPRPSPVTPFSVNSTPSLIQPSPVSSGANTPTVQGFQAQGQIQTHRKRSINKSDISEPRFISSTSRVTTVNLPPGSSLQNGIEAPPIPPVNPRRRQTRTMFGFGKKDECEAMHSLPAATQSTEQMSTFSADEGESKPKVLQKLRKSSSEGGNLNARVRQAAIATPSPAMPGAFPSGAGSPPRAVDGGMF